MATFMIQSSPMVYAPGCVRWAINAWRSPEHRPMLLDVFVNRAGFPEALVIKLLSGEAPFTVVDDNVVLEMSRH